jgi:hypothetical protein
MHKGGFARFECETLVNEATCFEIHPVARHDAAHAPAKALPAAVLLSEARRRCRMHGGLSTGPRTAVGLVRSKRAHWKHGRFSAEARQEAAHFRELLRECKEMAQLMAV